MFFTTSASSSFVQTKLPAKNHIRKRNPFKFGGKIIRASSPTTAMNQDPSLSRRRLLTFTATLPFLVGIHENIDGSGIQFSWNYYYYKFFFFCSLVVFSAYATIQEGLKKVLTKQKAAGLLRLVFHEAGTFDLNGNSGGMNGSIVYELERPENAGLKKPVKILEKVKSEFDGRGQVSWADIISVAGAEAVSVCGGPVIPVQLGRVDSMVPDPEGKLPEETLDASGLKQCFLQKGFSTQELVALSGAHTLGGKGFGSPTTFDNAYYKILLEKPWLSSAGISMIGLPSDRSLPEDDECLRWIRRYADDQMAFFNDFKNAYIKLVNSGASWKSI